MHKNYPRKLKDVIVQRLQCMPVVALLGPRQCGKTTLAKQIMGDFSNALYLDLENPEHLAQLNEAQTFLRYNIDRLIILDEIQLKPDLFPLLRSHIDSHERRCRILILGSASRNLIRQGSESLAGRISHIELTPFLFDEVPNISLFTLMERGGFPESTLSHDIEMSKQWRKDYLRSLIERDLPLLGFSSSPMQIRRLLSMLAHVHGELLNASKLGGSLGITGKTLKVHLEYLEGAFIIRTVLPYAVNVKKRLVKSPKIYFRDTGLLLSVIGINDFNDLLGHPVYGTAWESFIIEQIIHSIGDDWYFGFYRTQTGSEIDLILEKGTHRIGIEFKVSTAPTVSRGFYTCLEDLGIEKRYIICPIDTEYKSENGVTICGLRQFLAQLKGKNAAGHV